jgi:hypothetical protein
MSTNFTAGLTLFSINLPVLLENSSTPGFDSYVLEYEGINKENFTPGKTLINVFEDEGIKTVKLIGTKIVNGSVFSLQTTATFDVGTVPNFSLAYEKRNDQSDQYSQNYVISGTSFSFEIQESATASSPRTFQWDYAGGTTFSGLTSSVQTLLFSTTGIKSVGLTISNRFGFERKFLVLNSVNTPSISISANPTFGSIQTGIPINLQSVFNQYNGHGSSDVEFTWTIQGEVVKGSSVNSYFLEGYGTAGVTLFFQSKILSGLSGYTYAQYSITTDQIPVYYDPELLIAFNPTDPEYASYRNSMKSYGTEYKYINNSVPVSGSTWNSQTAQGQLDRYLKLRDQGWSGPVMVNCEYPYLTILYQKDNAGVDSSWKTNTGFKQEADRQGVDFAGLTLAGYKNIAIKCWQDISTYLKEAGCEKLVHYASTGVPFSNYSGVPFGMIESAPISGVTQSYYYYPANNSWYPTMRMEFDSGVTYNRYGALIKAQKNAGVFGAAAYSFVPNSNAGLCGAPYWQLDHVNLVGFSGGSTFVNATDFTSDSLIDGIKTTSAKMWLELHRAILQTVDKGFCTTNDVPEKMAAIVMPNSHPFFVIQSSGGGYSSRYKWAGTRKKDPQKTAEYELQAIYKDNYRVIESDYPEIKKPDEIWVWDFVPYYYISVPRRSTGSGEYTNDNILTWITRNAMEIEYLGRPELSPGNTLWFSGSTTDNINYFKNNSLSDVYWNPNFTNVTWWGVSGATFTSFLPSPCSIGPSSPLAPWLDFTKTLRSEDVMKALKHRLSQNSVDYLTYTRQKLNEQTVTVPSIL